MSLAIDGDYRPPDLDGPPDLDSWLDNSVRSDFYFACVSPELVKEIAANLGKITEELFSNDDAVAPEWDPEWRPRFDANAVEELKQAYARAAANSNALMVTVC